MSEAGLELWGGVECTFNRVGDTYFDQLKRSGHDQRLSDLSTFAELGLKTLRFPMIWEKMSPTLGGPIDWTWTDAALREARSLGLRIIAGLSHHGSGTREASIESSRYAPHLASFAAQVAERYPWIDAYTPVNEPLTTARFCGLYGLWFPHGRDARIFLRVLLNQIHATSQAMAAIRKVRGVTSLVQTEDVGRIFSTKALRYQADFENERRWLSFDLLCGRVTEHHPLWKYCLNEGLEASELLEVAANCRPPDIFGMNHYMTSNRFLDARLGRYPTTLHGGNGRHRYVDVESVRVEDGGEASPADLLTEMWARYQAPLAITELHLGCTREEQLRWFSEVWTAAKGLRQTGIDIKAVTSWALLGAFDWNSLVTQDRGHYETGAFDVRNGQPRPTAIAGMIKAFANNEPYDHPALQEKGWWHRPSRFLYPRLDAATLLRSGSARHTHRPLLLVHNDCAVAVAFKMICDQRGLAVASYIPADGDSTAGRFQQVLNEKQPWAVVHLLGLHLGLPQEDASLLTGLHHVPSSADYAAACQDMALPFMTFSSDRVFDGLSSDPYVETSAVAPACELGKSEAAAEAGVLQRHESSLVIRTGALFGPWDDHNFITQTRRNLRTVRLVTATDHTIMSATYLPDLVNAALDLFIDQERGVWHLTNQGQTTWADLAARAATLMGLSASQVVKIVSPQQSLLFYALGSERGQMLPPLGDAVQRYWNECRAAI